MLIYETLTTIIFIIILPAWLILGLFMPKLTNGFVKKLGIFKKPELNSKIIMFYGVSVGEIIALENLIKTARKTFPHCSIVITTGTKTGQEIAVKKLSEYCDFITYFPFDFGICIRNFFRKIKPSVIFVAETELWPNFANITREKNIPLYIINGRISDRTYNSYKKLSFLFGPVLRMYKGIYTQSQQDNTKLISIGARPETTTVMGNLKFDIVPKENDIDMSIGKNRLILAGSTHAGEDEIVLDIFSKLKGEFSDIKLMIAPRHPERHNAVYELIKKTGFKCGKRSQGDNFAENEIIMLDTMGELGKIYSLCEFAFIGGSFNKTGGHNPLEATIFNKPVLSGPSIHNFKDIYAILTYTDAAKIAKTPDELESQMRKLLTDKTYYQKVTSDCRLAFEQNRGALDFVINVMHKNLD